MPFEMSEQDRRRFAKLIAHSWVDESVHARYVDDPRATLAEYGIDCPAEAALPSLPAKPSDEIDVETLELATVGAGVPTSTATSATRASTLCSATEGCQACVSSSICQICFTASDCRGTALTVASVGG
jgi:hypothetical protein